MEQECSVRSAICSDACHIYCARSPVLRFIVTKRSMKYQSQRGMAMSIGHGNGAFN